MDIFQGHQFRIAKDTLRLSDIGARIMGGMSKAEARAFLHTVAKWSHNRITHFEEAVA